MRNIAASIPASAAASARFESRLAVDVSLRRRLTANTLVESERDHDEHAERGRERDSGLFADEALDHSAFTCRKLAWSGWS